MIYYCCEFLFLKATKVIYINISKECLNRSVQKGFIKWIEKKKKNITVYVYNVHKDGSLDGSEQK